MAAVVVTVAGEIDVVEAPPGGTHTGIAGVAIVAGDVVRQDDTTGKWVLSLATTVALSRGSYIALRPCGVGGELTAMREGVLRGFTLAGVYSSQVFISDTPGALADAAGTVSVVAGVVLAQFGELRGVPPVKLLRVDLP